MNDLIQELADQCYYYENDNRSVESFNKEKFAQLIIQECMDAVSEELPDDAPESKEGIHPYWLIKKHFDSK